MASTITIGRAPDNSLVVSQQFETVSNRHADLCFDDDGRLMFTDHSSNGTIINGREVRNQTVTVSVDDEIRLAGTFLLEWPAVMALMPELLRAESRRTRRRSDINPMSGQADVSETPLAAAQSESVGTERFSDRQSFVSHYTDKQSVPVSDVNKDADRQPVHRSNGASGRPFPWKVVCLCFVAFLAVMVILAFTVFDDVVLNLL